MVGGASSGGGGTAVSTADTSIVKENPIVKEAPMVTQDMVKDPVTGEMITRQELSTRELARKNALYIK